MTYVNETFRTYMELELREKIAKEIEAKHETRLACQLLSTPCCCADAAAIARGLE